MSLTSIKSIIEEFVLGYEPDLLVIKGKWGVGKTYLWQNIVNESSEKKIIGHKTYAYVSLFGINDLDSLKDLILASTTDSTKAHKTGYFVDVEKRLNKVFPEVMKVDAIKKYTGNLLSTIAFLAVKDCVICFDDIERRGKSLEIKNLLGIASVLKDQHNCKIVFILNDGKLSAEDKEEFKIHSEKLIDIELEFAPSADEVFDYVFKSHPFYNSIRQYCLCLEIKNIRTLQRIDYFVKKLSPYLKGKEMLTIESVLRSIVLFVWAYYDKEDSSVTLETLREYKLGRIYAKERNKEAVEPEEKKLSNLLYKCGFTSFSEFDEPLASFVEKGFLDAETFTIELDKKNKQAIARKGNDDFSKAWGLYNNSFSNNKDEFVEKLVSGFNKNVEYIDLHSAEESVDFLRKLGKNNEANLLVDIYVVTNSARFTPEFERHMDYKRIRDEYFSEKINEAISKFEYKFDFTEMMEKAALGSSLSFEESKFLAARNISEYVNYFKSLKSGIYWPVKSCLNFEELHNGHFEGIYIKTKEALKIIASENDMNKLRVSEMFGINIPDT